MLSVKGKPTLKVNGKKVDLSQPLIKVKDVELEFKENPIIARIEKKLAQMA